MFQCANITCGPFLCDVKFPLARSCEQVFKSCWIEGSPSGKLCVNLVANRKSCICYRNESMDLIEEKCKRVSDEFSRLAYLIKFRTKLKLFDLNLFAEDFVAGILNPTLGTNLKNLNSGDKSIPAIDLGSGSTVAVQVTTTKSTPKIQKTIDNFVKYGFNGKYQRLVVFIVGDKQTSYNGLNTTALPSFSVDDDIIDLSSFVVLARQNHHALDEILKVIDRFMKKNDLTMARFLDSDQDALREYRNKFDRAALQDPFYAEANYEAFRVALTELIELLKTGTINKTSVTKPCDKILDPFLKHSLSVLCEKIQGIRVLFMGYVRNNEIDLATNTSRFTSPDAVKLLDNARQELINHLNQALTRFGMSTIRGPLH